eukprot:TRINITY_DN14776_c1_g1_i1.p1 TRINITY_DN14776_c1_g1~~TRINITY_DN14776_c1_g1_i1.p1  ORF type:complete len:258 (+),score=67.35 TRINITY_DN14776_c1_g1_i1:38-811(+)
MFLKRIVQSCLSRRTGLSVQLCQAFSDKNYSDKQSIDKNVLSEVDLDNPEEIDAFEQKVDAENYNNLFYNLHNQKLPDKNIGIDIDNFEAIESYDKLFHDSYKKHQMNTKVTEEMEKFIKQSDDDEREVYSNTPNEALNCVVKAQGKIFIGEEAMKSIIDNKSRGDILTVAEVAGILGAKKTSELVPHYFSNVVHKVEIDIDLDIRASEVIVTAAVVGDQDSTTKALTGCSIALVTIFDHFKDTNKAIHVKNIHFKL